MTVYEYLYVTSTLNGIKEKCLSFYQNEQFPNMIFQNNNFLFKMKLNFLES